MANHNPFINPKNSNNYLATGMLKISGIDAKKLLQGQITCGVEKITDQPSLAAHCNPQGRIISLFRIFLFEDAYYLLMAVNMVNLALNAFKKYAVFYKVELIDATEQLSTFADKIISKEADIRNGVPRIYPETSGKFLPHELNLQQLNAISFDKGCYTGQEIIARMEYRGKIKTHMYRATIKNSTTPLPGQDIYLQQDEKTEIGGTVVDACEMGENLQQTLIVTNESNAKNNNLFLASDPKTFFMFL